MRLSLLPEQNVDALSLGSAVWQEISSKAESRGL